MQLVSLALLFLAAVDTFQLGVGYYSRREYAKAAEQFELVLAKEDPSSAAYRESTLYLAQSLYLTNRFRDALPYLEKAIAAKTRALEARYMLGNAYVQLHEQDKAAQTFAALYDVPPGSAAAYLIAAQMMIRQGLEENAEKAAGRALELNPKIPEAHYLLGEIATFHGEIDRAIAELGKEIQINPNFALAYYKLGDAFSRREQWEEAIPQLERSIWLNPTYSGPYIVLGKAYLKRKELPNAENILKQAIRMDPRNSSAHYLLGQTLAQQGRTEEAKKYLDLAQEFKAEK